MMKRVAVLFMAAALVTAGQAVLVDDFESYTPGTDPGTFGNSVTVEVDTGTNGTQVLQQTIAAGAGWEGAGIDWDDVSDDGTLIEFDVYFGSTYDGAVGISQWNGINYENFNDFQAMVRHGGSDGAVLTYRDGGSYINIDTAVAAAEEWHTFGFLVDYTNQNYDLYIDGSFYAADAGFRATGYTSSNSFRILGTIADSTVMVDNVRIVPEPATLALLGLGALVLRRKR